MAAMSIILKTNCTTILEPSLELTPDDPRLPLLHLRNPRSPRDLHARLVLQLGIGQDERILSLTGFSSVSALGRDLPAVIDSRDTWKLPAIQEVLDLFPGQTNLRRHLTVLAGDRVHDALVLVLLLCALIEDHRIALDPHGQIDIAENLVAHVWVCS